MLITDISPGMLDICKFKLNKKGPAVKRKLDFALQDGENLLLDRHYDLIISNACFQWFTDWDLSLQNIYSYTKPGGYLLFSTFGPQTFLELHDSFQKAYAENGLLMANSHHGLKLVGWVDIKKYLEKAEFSDICITKEIVQTKYHDVKEFLSVLKKTGARNAGTISRMPLNKQVWRKMQKFYQENFSVDNEIRCTYEILFCGGKKTC